MVRVNAEFATDITEKREKSQSRDAMLFAEFFKGEYFLEICEKTC
jgi:hypothetical protein